MPGRPKLSDVSRKIEAHGGEDVVFARIANGEKIGRIAASYGASRYLMYDWRNQGGELRRQKWDQAIAASAEALVEEAGEILDAAQPDSNAHVNLAKHKADWHMKLAGFRNEAYSDRQQAANVTLNIGEGLVQALRLRAQERQLTALPAEIVTDDTP
jgi:hypothetical protein